MALATFAVVEVAVPDGEVKFTTEPVVSVPVTPASFASGHPSPSESKSKLFGIPSESVSFEQVNLGFALDRFEDAKLNVAFATPPKLEVPATPYNLKYLYFLPA